MQSRVSGALGLSLTWLLWLLVCHLSVYPLLPTDESSRNPATATSATGNKEPIYHVLERPLLCEDCLGRDRRVSAKDLPCPSPPLPPRDFGPSTKKGQPVYERVENVMPERSEGTSYTARNMFFQVIAHTLPLLMYALERQMQAGLLQRIRFSS